MRCMNGRQVREEGVEHRPTTTLAAEVAGRGRLMVEAGIILAVSSPALAGHDTVGGVATGGGASFEAFLPIVVVVALVMVGIGFWGRKKGKTKSRRRRRRKRRN